MTKYRAATADATLSVFEVPRGVHRECVRAW